MRIGRHAGLAALVSGTAVVMVAVAGVVLPAIGDPPKAPAPAGRAAASAPLAGGATGADLGASVTSLQARLSRLPGDWTAWASLGVAYVGLARTSADPSYYAKADGAFARSLQVHPEGNSLALAGKASLAASRHDFAAAARLAERALAENPYDTAALGALTDAQVELGDYEGAESALQRMLDVNPGVPALARTSYLRELHGDLSGAREALEQALARAATPSDAAFALHYLSELAFNQGDLDTAARRADEGLRAAPAYVPLLAARARVLAARGETAQALDTWAEVVTRLPQPSYLAEYGDLLTAAGRPDQAATQYALVDATQRLFAAQGANVDLEAALFDADHGKVEQALAAARRERSVRSSVHVEDALAWALYRAGQPQPARDHALAAQRLGTRSALFAFHRGMIEADLGRDADARRSLSEALAINPHFNPLQAEQARRELERLGAERSAS